MLKILIIFSSILCLIGQTCYVSNNMEVYITQISNTSYSVNLLSRTQTGWIGFGIGENETADAVKNFYIIYNSVLYQTDGHSKNVVNTLNYTDQSQTLILSYQFVINYTGDINWIFFASNQNNDMTIHTWTGKTSNISLVCDPQLGLPNNLASISPFFYSTVQILYSLCIPAAYFLKDQQPTKSKPFSIVYATIANMMYSFGDYLTTQYSFEWSTYNGCFISSYMTGVFQQLIYIIPIIMYYRGLSLNAINKRKIDASNNINTKYPKFYKCLRFTIDAKVLAVIPIFYMIIYYVIMIIIHSVNNFKCTNQLILISYITNICLTSLVILILFFMTIFDIIWNIKFFIRCDFQDDPFYFRIENVCVLSLLIMFIISIIPNMDVLLKAMIVQICFICGIFANGGISLLISFYRHFFIAHINHQTIDSILGNKYMYQQFFKFCAREYSIENFLCRQEILDFNADHDKVSRLTRMRQIYENFLADYSDLHISISDGSVFDIIKKIQNEDTEGEVFYDLYKEVHHNISDLFARFTLTKQFAEYDIQLKTTRQQLK